MIYKRKRKQIPILIALLFLLVTAVALAIILAVYNNHGNSFEGGVSMEITTVGQDISMTQEIG